MTADNLVLEQLRAIREEMERMANRMETLAVEMTAMRHQNAGMHAVQEHDHQDIAALKSRLDRIENALREVPIARAQ